MKKKESYFKSLMLIEPFKMCVCACVWLGVDKLFIVSTFNR